MPASRNSSHHARRAVTTIIAIVASLALAVGAGAAVSVYKNDFSSKAEFKEIGKSGGGRCERSYRKKSKSMRAAVEKGPATCSYRPPVEGDNELPDHDVRVDGKILDKTPKSTRGGAFQELSIRVGGGGIGYSLRIFPEKKRFELLRVPRGGGGFPVEGKSRAINKVGERNQLRLVGAGAVIRAFVNREQVAKVTDDDPGQVSGRKIRFALGNQKGSAKDVVGTFKRVAVAVPG